MTFNKWLNEYQKSKEFKALKKGLTFSEFADNQSIVELIVLIDDMTTFFEHKHADEWTLASLKKVINYWIPKEVAGPVDELPTLFIIWSNFFLFLNRKKYFSEAKEMIVAIQEVAPLILERASDEAFWSDQKMVMMRDLQEDAMLSLFENLSGDNNGISNFLDLINDNFTKETPPLETNNVIEMNKPIKKKNKIYQVRIDIQGAKPPIWRRLLIPAETTFADLHEIIQIAFQWNDSHLHSFETRNFRIEPKSQDDFDGWFASKPTQDSTHLEVDSFMQFEKEFFYEYDFGDGWHHKIKVEAILERSPDIPFYPYCLKGKMHPPIDDIGGIWGYADFVRKVTEKPLSKEGAELLSWYTEDESTTFDPSKFDRELVNQLFQASFT